MPVLVTAVKNSPSKRGSRLRRARSQMRGSGRAFGLAAGGEYVGQHGAGEFVFQPKQAAFRQFEFVAHLLQPARMRQIARADDLHALQLRPFMQMLESQILTCGAGVMGMDVKIGDEFH